MAGSSATRTYTNDAVACGRPTPSARSSAMRLASPPSPGGGVALRTKIPARLMTVEGSSDTRPPSAATTPRQRSPVTRRPARWSAMASETRLTRACASAPAMWWTSCTHGDHTANARMDVIVLRHPIARVGGALVAFRVAGLVHRYLIQPDVPVGERVALFLPAAASHVGVLTAIVAAFVIASATLPRYARAIGAAACALFAILMIAGQADLTVSSITGAPLTP